MMSLLQTKLPRQVLSRLEEYKNNDDDWTVKNLRKELKKYIAAQEIGSRLTETSRENRNSSNQDQNRFHRQNTASFHVGEQRQRARQRKCIYCGEEHWSDECKKYPDLPSRKKQIYGYCYICLKKGHLFKDCLSKRICVYCNREHNHHRSLCPKQFQQVNANPNDSEPGLLAMEEEVIMQTAMVEVTKNNHKTTNKQTNKQTANKNNHKRQDYCLTAEVNDRIPLKNLHRSYNWKKLARII